MQTKNSYIKQIQMGSAVYDVYDMDAHTLIEGLQTAVTGGVHFCGILKGTYGTDVLENNIEVGLLTENLQTQDKDQSQVALVHGTGTGGTWATGDMIIDKDGIEYIVAEVSGKKVWQKLGYNKFGNLAFKDANQISVSTTNTSTSEHTGHSHHFTGKGQLTLHKQGTITKKELKGSVTQTTYSQGTITKKALGGTVGSNTYSLGDAKNVHVHAGVSQTTDAALGGDTSFVKGVEINDNKKTRISGIPDDGSGLYAAKVEDEKLVMTALTVEQFDAATLTPTMGTVTLATQPVYKVTLSTVAEKGTDDLTIHDGYDGLTKGLDESKTVTFTYGEAQSGKDNVVVDVAALGTGSATLNVGFTFDTENASGTNVVTEVGALQRADSATDIQVTGDTDSAGSHTHTYTKATGAVTLA